MKSKLSLRCLQNFENRDLISKLWNNEQTIFYLGMLDKNSISENEDKNINTLLSNAYENEAEDGARYLKAELLNSLLAEKIINIKNFLWKNYEIDYGNHVGIEVSLLLETISKQKLLEYVIEFSRSCVEEPLGQKKQTRVLKEQIKKKFIELENKSLKIRWKDIPTKLQDHFEVLSTLAILKNEGLISFELQHVDLSVEEFVLDEGKRPQSYPTEYGRVNFDASITLEDKLFAEWASAAHLDSDPVKFNISTGQIIIDGITYDFCKPNTTECALIAMFVKNLNDVVPHDEIALIILKVSRDKLAQMYEKQTRTEVNKQNKVKIDDLKKKIKKAGLEKMLRFEASQGYKLTYTRDSYDEEKLASELYMADIPF